MTENIKTAIAGPRSLPKVPAAERAAAAIKLLKQGRKLSPLKLIDVALELEEGGYSFVEACSPVFIKADMDIYLAWRAMRADRMSSRPWSHNVVREIERLLKKAAENRGWRFGALKQERYRNRAQFYVQLEGLKIVQQKGQTQYRLPGSSQNVRPRVGDEVAFHDDNGQYLRLGVWAMEFTLLARRAE